MVSLGSIVSLDKIEDNLDKIGMIAGYFKQEGINTPEVLIDWLGAGVHVPDVRTVIRIAKQDGIVKSGVVAAVTGEILKYADFNPMVSRVGRALSKIGTGYAIGGAAWALTASTHFSESGSTTLEIIPPLYESS